MGACWTQRGCDEEMWSTCPHAVSDWDMCPARCAFSVCDRPTHEKTFDPEILFDPSVDRMKAIKENCTFCTFFLTHGPRYEPQSGDGEEAAPWTLDDRPQDQVGRHPGE